MCPKFVKVVLTGRPYSGKTALLREFSRRGFTTVNEAATTIRSTSHGLHGMQRQVAIMMEQIRAEAAIEHSFGPVFLDRGVIDILAYSEMVFGRGYPNSDVLSPATRYDVVFWLDPLPWRETNTRRERSEEEATRVSLSLANCYGHWGYRMLSVPVMTITQRCDYILERLMTRVAFRP